MTPSNAPPNRAAPAPVPNSQNDRLRLRNCPGVSASNSGYGRLNILPDAVDVRPRLEPDDKMAGLACRQSDVRAGVLDIAEHVRRRRERANAFGDRSHAHPLTANFGGRADAGNAETVKVGTINRHGAARGQILNRSVDDIPGQQAAGLRAGDEHRGHASTGQLPIGKPDHQRDHFGHAICAGA